MHIEDVAPFGTAGKEKMRIVEIVTRIIGTEVSRSDVSPLDSKPAILEMAIGVVVEDTLGDIYDRLTPEADDAPRVLLPIEPSRIISLAHIGTIPDGDETLQVEGHFLASDTGLHFAVRQVPRIGDEALCKVERVPVRWSDYRFPRRVVVLELHKDLPVLVGPDIGVNVLTIQHIVLNGDSTDAKSRRVKSFEALAQIQAEGHIALRIIRRQWNIFQVVEWLGSQARISQYRPVGSCRSSDGRADPSRAIPRFGQTPAQRSKLRSTPTAPKTRAAPQGFTCARLHESRQYSRLGTARLRPRGRW